MLLYHVTTMLSYGATTIDNLN